MPGIIMIWAILLLLQFANLTAATLQAQAWQSLADVFTFPEQKLQEVMEHPNIGVAFSGGGSRAFTATMGILSAFVDLGYMDNIRYITGSSGGSWGLSVASYYQFDNVTDSTLFGEVVFPEDIVYSELNKMDPNCARSFTNVSGELQTCGSPTCVLFETWVNAVQDIYFSPAGIQQGSTFSYNNESVQNITKRNPNLSASQFQVLRGTFGNTSGISYRPYPIIQCTLIGPDNLLPATPTNRNYTLLEYTPLSVGVAYSNYIEYWAVGAPDDIVTKTIGGLVEPFAFNSTGPSSGLPDGASTGILQIDATAPLLDLALASGSSSWAPGTYVASVSSAEIERMVGKLRYWAPSAPDPRAEEEVYAVGDGAGVSNTDLISLLQRDVTTILAFVNTRSPLQNATNWNTATTPVPSVDDIDFTVPAWFGVIATGLTEIDKASYDLNGSQVFIQDDWLPFIEGLHAAQADGGGNVFTMTHTTCDNPKYGLKAGKSIKVVWSYLGRALGWESQLNQEMRDLVVPATDPENQAVTISSGPFKNFPGYATALADINFQRANLLADFTGWVVHNNKAQYTAALGLDDSSSSSSSSDSGVDLTLVLSVSLSAVALLVIVSGFAYWYFIVVKGRPSTPMASQAAALSSAEVNSSTSAGMELKPFDATAAAASSSPGTAGSPVSKASSDIEKNVA